MKKIALSSLLCVSATLFSTVALAQECPPGSFCAGAQVNTGIFGIGGNIQINPGVVTQPRPVYVQPAPPPPQPVYVQQPVYVPPPVYVQQPVYVAPPVRYVVAQPVTYTTTATSYQWIGLQRNQAFGLGAFASGLGGGSGDHRLSLWGAGATARFRYHPYFATEFTIGGYFGRDYNGDQRSEVPVTVNELIYFNPMHRLQVYGILGVGLSWAAVQYEGLNAVTRGRDNGQYTYVGGQAGLGLEWQITRNFSLFTDARAFVRTRVDGEVNTNPEYTRSNGTHTETTNTSVGITGQLGAMFYF